MFARDYFAAKTNLAVSSMEYCGCLHCERDVREALSGGCGHPHPIPNLGACLKNAGRDAFVRNQKSGSTRRCLGLGVHHSTRAALKTKIHGISLSCKV